jgi:hypothetical protein
MGKEITDVINVELRQIDAKVLTVTKKTFKPWLFSMFKASFQI